MSIWKLFFSFTGRISRGAYWWAILVCTVVFCICALVVVVTIDPINLTIDATNLLDFFIGLFAFFLLALTAYCRYPIAVKRWHDRDKSGWWVLIEWIPLIGSLWTIIECGFLKGTEGPNHFGPSPLM